MLSERLGSLVRMIFEILKVRFGMVTISLLIILNILSYCWSVMMSERLGALVRMIFEILKVRLGIARVALI